MTLTFAANDFGKAEIKLTASDAKASAVDSFFVDVTNVNDPVDAKDDAFSTKEGVAVSGNVLANDVDLDLPDGDKLSAFLNTSPGKGTLSFSADGSFTYTPNAGFDGTDTFTYTVRDRGQDGIAGNADDTLDTATVTITVSNVNLSAGRQGRRVHHLAQHDRRRQRAG